MIRRRISAVGPSILPMPQQRSDPTDSENGS